MNIKHRIYLSLFLLSLLPLALISVITEQVSRTTLKAAISSDFSALAREKALAIGRIIDANIHETRLLAQHPAIINGLKKTNVINASRNQADLMEEINNIDRQWIENKGNTAKAKEVSDNALSAELHKIKAMQPEVYGEIFVTDSLGATVAMTQTLSDYYQADEYWWQAGSKLKTVKSAYLDDRGYDESVNAIVIGVIVPVIDEDEFIGILKINFRVSTILDIVSGEELEPGHGLILARSDDTVISTNRSAHYQDTNISPLKQFLLEAPTVGETQWHGINHLVATYPMKHSFNTRKIPAQGVIGVKGETTIEKKWFVIFAAEEKTVYAELEDLQKNTMLLALTALVIASIVGFYLSRDINRPLSILKLGTEIIGKGDLSHRIAVTQKNEFGELASAFNSMTNELQQTLASRDELNREIEERKSIQTELSQFKSTLDQTMDCVFMFDPQTLKFFYVNAGAMSQIGYDFDELVNMTPLDIKPEFDETSFRKITESLINGPSHRIVFTTVHRHKDGYDIPVEVFLQYVAPVDTPPRFLAVVSDITEQKHAEEEKEQLQRHLNELLDAMPSIVVAVDQQAYITHWNREAERVTGIDSATAIGKPVTETLLIIEPHQEEILNAIHKGQKLSLERVTTGDDKGHYHTNILVYPLTATGIKGAVLRLDDVTEKTHMEDMMVQTEKMLSVGGLAGGMAHELNNPLGGMVQGIQNIRRRFSSSLDKNISTATNLGLDLEKVRQYMHEREIDQMLDMISDAGQRASEIVNNMLRFTRRPENLVQATDLKALIDQTIELASVDYDLKKKYDFKNIEINCEFSSNLPYVSCIPGELQQVLLNLLRNSAQALSENKSPEKSPKITLRVGLEVGPGVEPGVKHKKQHIRIEVEDNGSGMSAETQKRAFEPFYTTKPPGKGTGLGLSVSYYIIHDEHQGTINVESTPGKGTKFIIQLPVEGADGNIETLK